MARAISILVLLSALACATASGAAAPDYTALRGALADAIETVVNQVRARDGGPPIDPRVIAAMRKVPRHEFAPDAMKPLAYVDRPLTVREHATISQPSLVAVMTDFLRVRDGEKVLEVGVGGGYHTAILAELTPHVFSVEFHSPVAEAARGTLKRLGYGNVRVNVADSFYGWRPDAPYDAIVVRMAIPDVSEVLLSQLKPGGRLVAPIGPADGVQILVLLRKDRDGRITETGIMPVKFQPLPGGQRL